jgi:hypothetical protein
MVAPKRAAFCWLILLLVPVVGLGQGGYGRRTRGTGSASAPGGYNGPAVTFQGKLKELTKKELRIDVESEQQSITCRVTSKTQFMKDGKKIKLDDIKLGSDVAVDATREPDLKFTALSVVASPPKAKSESQ